MTQKYYAQNQKIITEIRKYRETKVMSESLGQDILRLCKSVHIKNGFIYDPKKIHSEEMISNAVIACIEYFKTATRIHNVYAHIQKVSLEEFKKTVKSEGM